MDFCLPKFTFSIKDTTPRKRVAGRLSKKEADVKGFFEEKSAGGKGRKKVDYRFIF
jgi:hypothetical protein